jgi:alpha-ribazole phosphatase
MRTGERKVWSDRGLAATTCRLLLVRHATAEGHGRFQGQLDVSLTSAGRREFPHLCEKCSRYPVQAVYASDLRRARQTAGAIARKLGLAVNLRPELREIHFGEWEGLSWNQIATRFPEQSTLWIERFPRQTISGGEPIGQFRKRIAAAVREIVAANRGQCALVVTHAGVIRFTLGRALGLPARNLFRLAQDSCAVNVIDFLEKGAIVRCING